MSSQQANPEKKQCSTTPCTTCRSHQVQCNGIHPSCGPCKNGNKTCVWPEDGRGPRRGSFTAAARFSILNLDKAPTRSSPRRSQPPKAPVASGRRRHGSGRLSKPAGNDGGPQQPQQAQERKQSQQTPIVSTHPRVISYKKLLEGDEETGAELLAACTNRGCFWLDLESEVEILEGAEWLLHISQTLHDIPQVEKWNYEEESPEGYNNIRYNYTNLPSQSPSEETDYHLSENWSFDLTPHTPSAIRNSTFSNHRDSFNWPTPLQNGHGNKLLTTISQIHYVGLTVLNALIAAGPLSAFESVADAHDPSTQTRSGVHLSRYPIDNTDDPLIESQPLTQLRDSSGSMAIIFAPVPGLCVQDVHTRSSIPVANDPTAEKLRYAFVSVGDELSRLTKGVTRMGLKHLWDVGEGREGDWYEVCYRVDVGGGQMGDG